MRKKMLFLSAQSYSGEDFEGETRTGGILGILLERFDIDLLAYGNSNAEYPFKGGTALSIYQIRRTVTPRRTLLRSLYRLRTSSYLSNANKDMRGTIKELCGSNEYSHVFISHGLLCNCIDLVSHLLPEAIIVTDAYRFKITNPAGKVTIKKAFNTPYHKLIASLVRWNEQKLMNRIGLLLATSEWDALLFKALSFEDAGKVHVVPHFIDMNQYQYTDSVPKENWIVLQSNMNNSQGAKEDLFFYQHIYPLIKTKVPDIKCFIVGKEVDPEIVNLVKDDESVTVTEPLESAARYIRQAKVFIVPKQEGYGTHSKILESWALRTPVVTSLKGSEGLICEHKRDILLANSAEDFADMVVLLLQNPILGDMMSDRAHQTLLKHYEANGIKERVLSLV